MGTKFIATEVLERMAILSEWFRIGFARFRAVSKNFPMNIEIRSQGVPGRKSYPRVRHSVSTISI